LIISHKKAQNAQKKIPEFYFVRFVPFCGYVLELNKTSRV